MRDVLAVIVARGGTESLLTLSRIRSLASVPFAGSYRLIDFSLSNCAHSGINHVAVLAQFMPHSLKAHIGVGRPWDLDRRTGGVRLLEPVYGGGEHHWYAGTADALVQNLDSLDDNRYNHILVMAGAFVYKMDYRPLLDFHRVGGAEMTLVVKAAGPDAPRPYGTAHLGRGNMVVAFDPPRLKTPSPYVSLGIYVFNRRYLVKRLKEVAQVGAKDIVWDLVLPNVTRDPVYAYLSYNYWADVTTVDEYYDVTFECLRPEPPLALDDPTWPIYTDAADDPPVKLGPGAVVENSLVANGCIINGEVRNSVLFRRVYVEAGATVADAILMDGTRVDPGAAVDRAIIDKVVRVGTGARVGADVGPETPNERFPQQLASGLVLVGKGAVIPPHAVIGRNCVIDITAQPSSFAPYEGGVVPNGASILLDS